jgi:hypothetical protein
VQLHSVQGQPNAWNLTTGFVTSYDGGEFDREFFTLQGGANLSRLSFYVSQELDYNRGWRREVEGSDVSWTNGYAHSRFRFTDTLSMHAGFDNRRNVRLYRDHETPETEFDDAYRQGYWAGFSQRLTRVVRFGADARRSTGSASGDAESYTANLNLQWRVHLGLRSTYFDRETLAGWMHSARLGMQIGARLHAELGGGTRDELSQVDPTETRMLTWSSVSLDYSLGGQWYLTLSGERSKGESETTDQVYATTSYRF